LPHLLDPTATAREKEEEEGRRVGGGGGREREAGRTGGRGGRIRSNTFVRVAMKAEQIVQCSAVQSR
jgi:hypothetical protein